jgi:putative membrane protein
MPLADNDPRVFFAAERTLLAWLRTGLTIIAIGVVMARFSLFVLVMGGQAASALPPGGIRASALLGVGFVVAGSLAIVGAVVQHHRFVATLAQSDLPPRYSRAYAVGMALALAALGLLLAGYLAFETR